MGARNDGGARRRGLGLVALVVAVLLGAVMIERSCDEQGDGGGSADGSSGEQPPEARPTAAGGDDPGRGARAGGATEPMAPIRLMTARATADETATAGAVSGVVLSRSDGSPIEGAILSFMRAGVTRDVASGQGGAFEFAPPRAGRYELAVVSSPGYLPFAPELGHSPLSFHTREGRRIEGVRIYLVPRVEYTGVVLDDGGEPVAGASVRLLGADTGEQRLAPLDDRFTTDDEGEFAFHAPDDAVLEARHPDAGIGRAKVGFQTQVSKRLVIRLDPDATESAGVIAGRVLDADGEPLADAAVRAVFEVETRASPGADLHPVLQATSAPDGRFRLEGLDEGSYTVIASAPRHATAREAGIAPDVLDLELRLEPEAVLSGTVTDEAGEAVPAFAIVVQRAVGAVERRTAAIRSVFDPEGAFEVGGLDPGSYIVTAVARGRARSEPLGATAPAEGLLLVLPAGGRIEGTVTSAADAPIEGARVTLEGVIGEGASAVPLAVSTTTDSDGRYELAGVGERPSSIFVAASGHHARVVSGLRVPSGGVLPVDVELTPTAPDEEPRVELAGIGVVLSAEEDVLRIGRVVEGGGAAEVGLGPGDAIEAVEGVPVGELGFQGSIERIRGPEGSAVRLRIRRTDGTVVEIDVPRRRIRA